MNNTALLFTGLTRKEKLLALRAYNVPWGKAQELLATGHPIHVPMNQRLRELLNRRASYETRRAWRRRQAQ